jgi:phage tail-like protein
VAITDLPSEVSRSAEPGIVPSSGRGLVPGLDTPVPLGPMLPALFQEDGFAQRMMVAFDECLAPVFSTLDCLDSYLDPALAPADFIEWLASWVGVEIDETWTLERRRKLIHDAAALYRIRGTGAGLTAHLHLYADVDPEIEESGGCAWSQTADAPLPGRAEPSLVIRLHVRDGDQINPSTVRRIVEASRPAHLPFSVEVRADAGELTPGDAHAVDLSSADHGTPAPLEHEPGTSKAGPVGPPGAEHVDLEPPAPFAEDGEGSVIADPPDQGHEGESP